MTYRLKCPICGGEMIGAIGSPVCHYNQDCPIHDRSIPQEIYDLVEHTRKALDVAVDALKKIGSGNIIEHSVVGHENDNKIFLANKALEQITALEQKDVK